MSRQISPRLRLDGYLPFRFSVLSNAISSNIARIYEEEFGLSIWQWRIVAILGETNGLTSTQVGERALMDKWMISRTVTSLQKKGLLVRGVDPIDRRRVPLTLTESGKAIYDAIVPRALALEQDLLSALSDTDRAELQRLLGRLATIASPDRALWSSPAADE